MAILLNPLINIMKLNKYRLLFLVINILFLAILPQGAHSSNSTNNCHCFKNRTFNTANKFASDDYLLTTTFNSLLASEFTISKRQIIMMKMQDGVANNDLIISLYISKETGVEVPQLLTLKNTQSWTKIIEQLKTETQSSETDNAFNFITANISDDQIAEYITNLMINARFSSTQESLELLRDKKFTAKEIILVHTLASHTGSPILAITDQYRKNGLSWSEIAYNFGLEPANVGKLLDSKKAK